MAATAMDQTELRKQIMAIQMDSTLTDVEKGQRRQALMSGAWKPKTDEGADATGAVPITSLEQDIFPAAGFPAVCSHQRE